MAPINPFAFARIILYRTIIIPWRNVNYAQICTKFVAYTIFSILILTRRLLWRSLPIEQRAVSYRHYGE